jgi:hypothetical protein
MNYRVWERLITGQEWRRFYTIHVFGENYVPTRKLKKMTLIERRRWGILGWNPNNAHEPGRLPNSGCFTWVGCLAARRAAMEFLTRPAVTQVQIHTNQDRTIYVWNKATDGTVTGYGYDPEDWQWPRQSAA